MAGINLIRLDLNYTPTPTIPMFWPIVQSLGQHFSKLAATASFAEMPIELPVVANQLQDETVRAKGLWLHTSPTELIVAWVSALADALRSDPSDDNEELGTWRHHMLTVPAFFKLLPSEA